MYAQNSNIYFSNIFIEINIYLCPEFDSYDHSVSSTRFATTLTLLAAGRI